MKTSKRSARFITPAAGILVIPQDGRAPYRADGKPLTGRDREWLAGRDPHAEQIAAVREADKRQAE